MCSLLAIRRAFGAVLGPSKWRFHRRVELSWTRRGRTARRSSASSSLASRRTPFSELAGVCWARMGHT
eukprot:symbB.v1.2.005900.t1/scaffold329.1/size228424/10